MRLIISWQRIINFETVSKTEYKKSSQNFASVEAPKNNFTKQICEDNIVCLYVNGRHLSIPQIIPPR